MQGTKYKKYIQDSVCLRNKIETRSPTTKTKYIITVLPNFPSKRGKGFTYFISTCKPRKWRTFREKRGRIAKMITAWSAVPHTRIFRLIDSEPNLASKVKALQESYAYWTVHHLDIWIKVDQLDDTCLIIYCSTFIQTLQEYLATTKIKQEWYGEILWWFSLIFTIHVTYFSV